jgi:hypothetical protein
MPVIASMGSEVAVFNFRIYSIERDEYVMSRRLATAETIKKINGVMASPSYTVPRDDVIDGITAIDYDPYPQNEI